jgi:hypothetical protein
VEEKNQTVPDGKWILWAGGECPVGDSAMVDVEFRDRTMDCGSLADDWVWDHSGVAGDIIAYR